MSKILALVALMVLISMAGATMQTDYPNAIARYTAFGINIPTETQFKSFMLGQDNWKDKMNPAIGYQTWIIKPGTPLITTGTPRYDLWNVTAILAATRTYADPDGTPNGVTPLYSVYSAPKNGFSGPRFFKTTRDLNEAYIMYSNILALNLYEWEILLSAPGRTKADILSDIISVIRDRTTYYRGIWGRTAGSGFYELLVKLDVDLYAYQIQPPGTASPNNAWNIGTNAEAANALYVGSSGQRPVTDIKNDITNSGFPAPSTYSYVVKGLTTKQATIVVISNNPPRWAYQISGTPWKIDANGGGEIVAALL
jgi:hypothetical protein